MSVDEGAYRRRRILGMDYFQSRVGFDGASLTAYRFPCQIPEKTGWSVPVFVVGCLGCQFVDVSVS